MHKIPVPITFNPHKHHFQFLKQKIEEWNLYAWDKVEKELIYIGDNLLDFYLGDINVRQICSECLLYFRTENINDFSSFKKWLGTNEYCKIQLSDSSQWIIKQGIDEKRYIHIHPAKYSRHTVRIRAITLKTVLSLQVHSIRISNNMNENLEKVNYIRENYLHLSPVKSLNKKEGIYKIWKLFDDDRDTISSN